ncbi:MAG: adenylate/guanylate cyclase domain-containing protein [Thermodesulfobacteriota bacterium]|nr:adenylate/guanylate cyclase domain-containing protein [Thermodesulfobacteriota bacterium]
MIPKQPITLSNEWSDPTKVSLRGLYTISVLSMGIGIAVVFVLNFATPTGFVLDQFAEVSQMSRPAYGLEVGKRLIGLFSLILVIGSPTLLVVRQILRPISRCLSSVKAGQTPSSDMALKARHRLINLPFIFVGFNVGMWVLMPALVFFSAYMFDLMNLRTAVVFSARASMVGLITSSIAFYRLEAYSRRKLIPFFFPKGRLADLKDAAKMSISRRIKMFNRLGTVVPMIILLVTLVTVQWELDTSLMSAEEYGRRIIIFTLVLCCIFFFSTGVLHRLVSKSITQPLENMLGTVAKVRDGDYGSRIRVLGNDEIGVLGDAGNVMIKGLAERETLRNTFGKYVTPEIRDEILSGRIPLEGERREATVMFADLRDFTPFVEGNPPEEVILGMRAYFTSMHQAIRLHRGLVLQFVGDEIEAVFGVPVHFEGHADAAVRAALEMRSALEELNMKRSAQGKPIFAHGIGIHSGDVLAGNTGSEEQSAYALIGNTVNVASRIQGLTKELGSDILASGETVARLKDSFHMDKEPPRLVKGYSRPITVHRILGRAIS